MTLISLGLGAIVVQAALSDDTQSEGSESEPSPSAEEQAEALAEEEVTGPDAPGAAGSQPQAAPIPVLEGNDNFRITCPTGDPARRTNTCEVESFGGFSERVIFSCAELPQNVSCSFIPASVTPRGTGSTPFRIELSAGNVPAGSYDFEVIGRSGDKVSRIRYPWGVSPAPVAVVQRPAPPAPPASAPQPPPQTPAAPVGDPTFSFTCGSLSDGNKLLWSLSKDGPNVKINCFLTPLNGFNEPVTFTFAQTSEVAKPDTVSFLLDRLQVRKLFDLNFEFSDAVKNLSAEQLEQGVDYVFDVTGTSATGKSLTRPVTLTVKE